MKFKDLPVGATFIFAMENEYSMARGPWRKVAARTYEDVENFSRHKVGTTSALVVRKEDHDQN